MTASSASPGRPIPTLQSIDTAGRVVYMNTFSQTISPSMRVGFMVLPPGCWSSTAGSWSFYACTVPALDQHVLARFLDRGHYEQHLARMRKEYRPAPGRGALRLPVQPPFGTGSPSRSRGGAPLPAEAGDQDSDAALQARAAALGVRLGFLSAYAAIPSPPMPTPWW